MIIVFFHVLYLISKIVYKNFRSARFKETSENVGKSCLPASSSPSKFDAEDDFLEPYDKDDDDDSKSPRFSPPAYIQRYLAVSKVLVDPRYGGKIKKVVDFGCSELGFITYLKHTDGIEEIVCVDIDRDTLEIHKDKAVPLTSDFLQSRPNPLTIHVCEGSVTHNDKKLENCDAVVAIELIEHLYPDILMDLPHNIFGYVKPLVAIITTPNADFNVLFPMKKKFRHWDHKFEWTRQQFEDWANNIVTRYPDYKVTFEGVGQGPSGTEDLGCCSQMAIFSRTETSKIESTNGIEGLFKVVTSQEYPYRVDNRSDEEKILDEASYHIRRFTQNNPECLEEYPLSSLLDNLQKFYTSADTLREILSNGGWMVIDRENGPAILCPPLSTFSDYDDDLENDLADDNDDSQGDNAIPPNYEDVFGTWSEDNIENIYNENWDDEYEIPVVNRINENFSNDADLSFEIEFSTPRIISEDFDAIDESQEEIPENLPLRQESSSENANEGNSLENGDNEELASLCSIYLESSRNEDRNSCPENITNPSFDCASLVATFDDSAKSASLTSETPKMSTVDKLQILHSRLSSTRIFSKEQEPNFTSSPRVNLEEDGNNDIIEKSDSQSSLRSNGTSSTGTTGSSTSFRTVKKFYPPEVDDMYRKIDAVTLKGGNETSDVPNEEQESIQEQSSTESFIDETRNLHVTRLERQKIPGSLKLRSTTDSVYFNSNGATCSEIKERRNSKNFQDSENFMEDVSRENLIAEEGGSSKIEDEIPEIVAGKTVTPETPPNSWSPEIMDSGYPNSSSMQDTTPEYDLSSIAQDRISDSESPSVADDAPRPPGFHELPEVENGDLANNNRDDEGNNVMAIDNDIEEDLQPLIDVLENDIENENDIYVLENGFPMWLLRILERGRQVIPGERRDPVEIRQPYVGGAAGDAGIPDLDEGFDSTSSENEDSEEEEEEDDANDDDDDDENVEEVSTESSEPIVWNNISGDHC